MIEQATQILSLGQDITAAQMGKVMEEIMEGKSTTPEIISFLNALGKQYFGSRTSKTSKILFKNLFNSYFLCIMNL